MTEAEVRQMQEKAANQWMREERRGDRRGGAEDKLVAWCWFSGAVLSLATIYQGTWRQG